MAQSLRWRLPDRGAALPRRRIMAVSKDLLDILVCPKCKGDLVLTEQSDGLVCNACRLMYEIRDDIPIMLIDEAVQLGDSDEKR